MEPEHQTWCQIFWDDWKTLIDESSNSSLPHHMYTLCNLRKTTCLSKKDSFYYLQNAKLPCLITIFWHTSNISWLLHIIDTVCVWTSYTMMRTHSPCYALEDVPKLWCVSFPVFCVGGLVDNGLKFGVHLGDQCPTHFLTTVQPVAQALFMFFEVYFVFNNTKVSDISQWFLLQCFNRLCWIGLKIVNCLVVHAIDRNNTIQIFLLNDIRE